MSQQKKLDEQPAGDANAMRNGGNQSAQRPPCDIVPAGVSALKSILILVAIGRPPSFVWQSGRCHHVEHLNPTPSLKPQPCVHLCVALVRVFVLILVLLLPNPFQKCNVHCD